MQVQSEMESINEKRGCTSSKATECSGIINKMLLGLLLCMALIIITFAIYWQVGDHEFLNYDDADYVWQNSYVMKGITGSNIVWALTSVDAANWHPVTWLSHMADVQLYGLNPRGHHLTNVAIHATSTALLFFLLFRLTGAIWQSFTVAALFSLHPLHVQSVAWVAERKDLLCGLFWFLTLLLYAEYVTGRKARIYIFALLSFVLGLMSKPMLVTLPVVMLLLDFWPLNRCGFQEPASGRRSFSDFSPIVMTLFREKIPFFVCSVFSSAITIYAQNKGGAIRAFDVLPIGYRIENAIIAYVTYIFKTIWPHDLAIFYPAPPSIPLWQVICSLVVLLLISTAALLTRRHQPYFAVGWFWFLSTLLPVIGIIQVGSQSMADRYTYIPLTGLFIMMVWGFPALVRNSRYRPAILALTACALLVASAASARQQLKYWHDDVSLFQHALDVSTGNAIAHNNLGFSLARKGNLDAAIKEFREALALNPRYVDAYNNLGLAYAKTGNLEASIKEYQNALAINPGYFDAHINLGNVFARKGDLNGAIRKYQEALAINMNSYLAHSNLGNALAEKGNLDAAIMEYKKALMINPNYSVTQRNLGIALALKKRLDEGLK